VGGGIAFHIDHLHHYLSPLPNYLGAHHLRDLGNIKFPTDPGIFGITILLPPPAPSGRDVGHFVAMVFDTSDYHEIDFFDSFGRSPHELGISDEIGKLIQRFLSTVKPLFLLKLKINTVKKQKPNSNHCGSFTTQFLLDRLWNRKNFKKSTGFNTAKMLQRQTKIKTFVEKEKKRRTNFPEI